MTPSTIEDSLTARQCADVLKALSDETRLQIVKSLLLGEKCVNDLARELCCPQPHVSHHLRILRDSRLVEGLREGKQVCYRVIPSLRRGLTHRQGEALDFGCCELRFPESTLANVGQVRRRG